jgi:hypothetical protein
MTHKPTFRSEALEERSLLASSCVSEFQMTASCVLGSNLDAAASAVITGGNMVLSSDASDLTKTYFNLNNATLSYRNGSGAEVGSCSLINGQSGAGGSADFIKSCDFTESFSGAKTKVAPGFLAPVTFPLATSIAELPAPALNAGEITFKGPAKLTWTIDSDRCQSNFDLKWDVLVSDGTNNLNFATQGVGSGVTAKHNPNINFDMCKSNVALTNGAYVITESQPGEKFDGRMQKLRAINKLFPLS